VREHAELEADNKGEHKELTAICADRDIDHALPKQVTDQLMAHDALDAHASDELGISETLWFQITSPTPPSVRPDLESRFA